MPIKKIINKELNTSTYTEIVIPAARIRDVLARTRDSSPWLVSNEVTGDTYFSFDEKEPLSLSSMSNDDDIIFYAKATIGTPILEVMWN